MLARRLAGLAALGLICTIGSASFAFAQSAENVGVVVNDDSPASKQIAEYYVRKRGIPSSNLLHIKTATTETIERAAYTATIEQPLIAEITRLRLQDRLLYLVLTKGVPLRVAGDTGETGSTASVDSELTLLYPRMAGENVPVPGRAKNPYFLDTRAVAEAQRFSHRNFPIYLVTRLDGFTVQDVLTLIDRSVAPSQEGRIVLDQRAGSSDRIGNEWLETAARRLEAQGQRDRVLLDTSATGVRNVKPVLGYYSWGSNDPNNRVRSFNFGFVPGSIAALYVSTDGRTFNEPPRDWQPGGAFAGSSQSLIGDLIHAGVTGVAGHVAEPTLLSAIRPDILFPAYLAGMNLAEAFYLAMPHLSWQTVVIGDPLGGPFARAAQAKSETDPAVDAETELPPFFSKRRLMVVSASMKGVPEPTLKLALRAESRLSRGDAAGARATFEEVTREAPGLIGAHLQLAILYDSAGQHDAAIERYRTVIKLQPRNVIALNNLAHDLAVRKGQPDQALPFAQQAGAIDPRNPVVLDTLAWIEHLRGNNAISAKLIAIVVQRTPERADVRMRAAIIYAAAGARAQASTELAEAVRLEPALENSEDAKRLRTQLGGPGR